MKKCTDHFQEVLNVHKLEADDVNEEWAILKTLVYEK